MCEKGGLDGLGFFLELSLNFVFSMICQEVFLFFIFYFIYRDMFICEFCFFKNGDEIVELIF